MMVFIPLLPFRFALHRSTWTSFSLHTGIAVLIHVEMRRIEGCLTTNTLTSISAELRTWVYQLHGHICDCGTRAKQLTPTECSLAAGPTYNISTEPSAQDMGEESDRPED